jgi:two-component system C4-dicarboxylate transport sensor histidine kinase DctB
MTHIATKFELFLMYLLRQNYFYLVYALLAVGMAMAIYIGSYRANLDQLRKSGQVRIEQISERLLGRIASYQQLPNLLAQRKELISFLKGEGNVFAVSASLLNSALLTGASDIYVLDQFGIVISTSNIDDQQDLIGQDFSTEPHVKAAMEGSLGFYHSIDNDNGNRNFFFARGVTGDFNKPLGVVVVQVQVDRLEFGWSFDEEAIAFLDNHNVVFVTNRPSLTLRVDDQSVQDVKQLKFREYDGRHLLPFYAYEANEVFDHKILNFESGHDLPSQALVLYRHIPQINLTAEGFFDTAEAGQTARLQALLGGAIFLLFGIAFWALGQRRQRLTDRLAVEAASNIELEARVKERGDQLRKAQNQLIQASKLTALGQLSAGVAHEVNQPLAAIQNFADTGKKLIDKGRIEEAAENLKYITTQTYRIGRIIKNLRGFARNEVEALEAIDLSLVITESLGLVSQRCRQENVVIDEKNTQQSIMVLGGKVRFEQVLVNLINNALDAIIDQYDKHISLRLSQTKTHAEITILDNGPGLSDPSRVFEPFYTTKDVGSSNGLGLGLAISYGIIGSFDGELSCRNHPDGGAEFTITVPLSKPIFDEKNTHV